MPRILSVYSGVSLYYFGLIKTMPNQILHWISWLWLAWFIAWWLLALWHKPVRQTASPRIEYGHRILVIAGIVLLWEPFRLAILRTRIYNPSLWLLWASLCMVIAGIAMTFWARFTLGANWDARVVVKQDHELIRRGPYARIRHPIYSGILLAILGTLAATGRWSGVLGYALVFIGLWMKAHGEEHLLAPIFGTAFSEHQRRTGMFLPRWRQSRVP